MNKSIPYKIAKKMNIIDKVYVVDFKIFKTLKVVRLWTWFSLIPQVNIK